MARINFKSAYSVRRGTLASLRKFKREVEWQRATFSWDLWELRITILLGLGTLTSAIYLHQYGQNIINTYHHVRLCYTSLRLLAIFYNQLIIDLFI